MAHTLLATVFNGKPTVCVIFFEDALNRVLNHDPAVIPGRYLQNVLPAAYVALPIGIVEWMIAWEPNAEEFHAKCKELGTPDAIIRYLARNWENRPGEAAARYVSVRDPVDTPGSDQ